MKGFIAILILLLAGIFVYYPFVSKEKACYDKAQKSYDDIGYTVAARGSGLDEQCRRRTDALLDLEDCVKQSTGSSVIAKYSNFAIEGMVSLIRPVAKGLYTLKSEHNAECFEYSTYQVE